MGDDAAGGGPGALSEAAAACAGMGAGAAGAAVGDGEVDWAAVRRAYEMTGETIREICARFRVSPRTLTRQRRREGWTPRAQIARPPPRLGARMLAPETQELRLTRLVAMGTGLLEKKVAEEGMTEANARTLFELCRAQEIRMRTTRTEKAAKARETKKDNGGPDFRDDPAWLRAELERRILKIRKAAGLEGAAGGSDG